MISELPLLLSMADRTSPIVDGGSIPVAKGSGPSYSDSRSESLLKKWALARIYFVATRHNSSP
ncbi:hypothetical protein TIFTF001_042514 [Ficus carica]|uniref:Uncharacterized protein n=1 Tax=Ficus carica TaxID=3494 RepID=A0AA88A3U3_FICCA|nr:hypothetical protein TIFTF001_042514 [Ficus carica]